MEYLTFLIKWMINSRMLIMKQEVVIDVEQKENRMKVYSSQICSIRLFTTKFEVILSNNIFYERISIFVKF